MHGESQILQVGLSHLKKQKSCCGFLIPHAYLFIVLVSLSLILSHVLRLRATSLLTFSSVRTDYMESVLSNIVFKLPFNFHIHVRTIGQSNVVFFESIFKIRLLYKMNIFILTFYILRIL